MNKNRIKINLRLFGAPLAVALLLAAFGLARAGVLAPPQVVDVEPDPGVHTAPVDSSISITYDQDMDPATVNPQTFAVHARQTGMLMELLGVTGGTITLDPLNDLHAGELVQTSATTETLSMGGEAPITPTVWQFSTAPWGGNAAFHEHQILEVASSRDAALGDLDGDSDLDTITTGCGTSVVRVYHNDGSGTFIEVQSFQYPNHCQLDAELGDLDGDGDLDALIIDYWGNPNRVLLNDGDGTFSDNNQIFWSNGDTWAELGDLDGDGDLDVFVAADNINNYLRVWLNDGTGNFSLAHQFDSFYAHTDVALGDLDGDYDLDAFTAGNNNSYNKVWLNDGSGAFSEAQAIPNANTWGVQLGDLNGDGHLDAYLANMTFGYSNLPDEIWLNDGTGYFTDSGQELDAASNAFPALGDLDADGDLDIYIGAAVFEVAPDEVWLNDGAANFSLGRTIDDGFYGGGAMLGDLDGDGNLDALALGGDHGYQVLLNGDWTQAEPIPQITTLAATIHCPDDPNGFYLLGGYYAYGYSLDDFRHYDAVSDQWTDRTSFPHVAWSPLATCSAGKIYAVMGWDFYIYDIASDTWNEGSPPPRYMESGGMGAWNGSLYAVGGYDPDAGRPDGRISRYDIASGEWTLQIGDMPDPVYYAGWTQVGPYLYAVGGNKTNIINSAETYRYDMSNNTWEQGPDLASPRWATGLVTTGSRLYALGGVYQFVSDVFDEVYYQELSTWPNAEWTELDDPLPVTTGGMSASCTEAIVGGEIWSTGGFYVPDVLDTNLYYPAEPCIHYGLALAPESLAGEGEPGETIDYTLTLTNTGNTTDYFSLTASSLWAITYSETVGPLGAGESAEVIVSITIPADAEGGDADTASITAASISNAAQMDSSTLTTTYPAVYDLELIVEVNALTGMPGETVTFSVQISNQGNITDTYGLDCLGDEWPMDMPFTQVTLAPEASADVILTVHIPLQAMPGQWDAMTFTAVSLGDPNEAHAAELTTTVIGNLFYLPVIVR